MKITKIVLFEYFDFGISTNFVLLKAILSDNTVWPQASGFQKLAKLTIFGRFY